MSSAAQIAANQANAQLSTGPKTEAGRANSSLNAVSTGLTGRTVLLPSDDAKVYAEHIASYFARFEPATPEEEELVQELAQTKWRVLRIPQLEEDLWALGTINLASMFEDQPADVRAGLIRAQTYMMYGKRFDNLFLQESRLTRRYEKLQKQLGEIQFRRQAAEMDERAAARRAAAKSNGFEFSNGEKVRPEERKGHGCAPPNNAGTPPSLGGALDLVAVLREFSPNSFSSLSPAEKAKVLEEVNQRLGKPNAPRA
ncbi:MAG TPA: hypothetical protein VH325_18055 [Bryobacteraceae bacterium]|jgi:hypothetical protein|nr:hypothetical protein [Bryobacteraceae bacterium]